MIQRPGFVSIAEYERMIADGEFDQLEEHVELIRGELHFMSPAGPFHGDVVAYLTRWTVQTGGNWGYMPWPQQGVSLAELISIPEPDVAWVRLRRYKKQLPTVADVGLVIEVSHSSLAYDRNKKAPLYAEAGIQEYWIANCEEQCIEVYRNPVGTLYTQRSIIKPGERISPLVAPEASLDVADVYADE
jgi:Uma2 family endonuclease